MTNILLLCDKEWVCRHILQCLDHEDRGIFVIATWPRSPIRYSRRVRKFASQKFPCDGPRFEEARRTFLDFVLRNEIDIVIPSDLETIRFLGAVGDLPGSTKAFPVPDRATLERLHDKWLFHDFLRENGLPTPKSVLLRGREDIGRIAFAFPVIVKPLAEAGSRGIRVFDDRKALERHLGSGELEFGFPLIAQEFVPGTDIDLSILAIAGEIVAWTVQSWNREQMLEFSHDMRCYQIGRKIVERTGFHGLAHFDMRLGDRNAGITVIECNPRFWETVAASMWMGTNFAELGIEVAMTGSAASVEPAIGTFVPNGTFLFRAFRGKAAVRELLGHEYGPLLQLLADPLPGIVHHVQKRLGRSAPFTANA